ncbi:MAG: GumC family protein [Candidatus Calescibacterium sp.]
MDELSLKDLLFSIYRWRKVVLISFVLLFSITFGLQKLTSPKDKKIFASTATVKVLRTTYVPVILRDIGIDIKPLKFDAEEERIKVKSEENLKTAISILGWDITEENINKLSRMIEVSVNSRENTIDITAYSENAYEARDVANAVANAYVQNSKRWFEQSIDNALNFLKESSEEVAQKLKESYDQLSRFSSQTGIVDPSSQFAQALDRIKQLRRDISKIDMKIQAIEGFFQRISKNPSKTAEHLKDLDRILMRDSLPENEEAVSELKDKAGRIIAIDKSAVSAYTKYFELEKKREELLTKYSEDHPKVKEIDREIQKIFENIIYQLKLSLAELKLEKQSYEKEIENLKSDIQYLTGNISEYLYLSNNIDLLNRIFENYYNNFAELKMTSGMWAQFAQIHRSASLPSEPIKRLKFQIILSLLVALVGSIVSAFILESLDIRFKSIEEIPGYLKMPVFGIIPKSKQVQGYNTDDGAVKEAIRSIRIMLNIIKGNKLSVLIVSCEEGEGKTFFSNLISHSFSEAGLKTALLDFNLRHPALSQFFGLPEDKSLIRVISENSEIQRVCELAEFKINNNLSLFGISEEFNLNPDVFLSRISIDFISCLKDKFDVLVADSSPLLVVSDALPIVNSFDVVIVIYDIGMVGRKKLRFLIDRLKEGGAKDIRLVVNKATYESAPDILSRSNRYYYYYYYSKSKAGKGKLEGKN